MKVKNVKIAHSNSESRKTLSLELLSWVSKLSLARAPRASRLLHSLLTAFMPMPWRLALGFPLDPCSLTIVSLSIFYVQEEGQSRSRVTRDGRGALVRVCTAISQPGTYIHMLVNSCTFPQLQHCPWALIDSIKATATTSTVIDRHHLTTHASCSTLDTSLRPPWCN